VLARILAPEDFGLIGIVTFFFAISNTFIDSGFSVALIRKLKCNQLDYNSVFFFNISLSLLFYSILFLSAPYFSAFFKQPLLVDILRIQGLVIVIDSFSIVQRAILTRDINFKLQTKVSLLASLISGILGISMAYAGQGVWSLVLQIVFRQFFNGIFLWLFSYWKPTISFSFRILRELFGFSSKILGTSLIVALQNNIYYFIIGKFFTPSLLGYYTRAEQFNAIVTNSITGSFDRVFFPVLSSIQENEDQLRNNLRKVLRTSFLISFFALGLLAMISKPLIYGLIGSKWDQSIMYLQLLCIGSIFYPFNVINNNILKIKGRSDLILQLQVIKTFLTALIVLSGILFGITIMLIVRIFTIMVATYLNSSYSGKLLNYSFKSQIKDILPFIISFSLIFIAAYLLILIPLNMYVIGLIQLIASTSVILIYLNNRNITEFNDIKSYIKNFIPAYRSHI
jgi:O-antigen/teichoic acid export membrane protein